MTWSPNDCTNRCSSCKGEGRNEQFWMGWRGQAGLLSRTAGLDWLKPAMKQLYWTVKARVKFRCSESYLGGVSRSPRLYISLRSTALHWRKNIFLHKKKQWQKLFHKIQFFMEIKLLSQIFSHIFVQFSPYTP